MHIPNDSPNKLTGRKHSGDDSASLWTGDSLQFHRVLRGGAELSHVVGDSRGTQHHLLGGEKPSMTSILGPKPGT